MASAAVLLAGGASGCARLQHYNKAAYIERHIRASQDDINSVLFKASILVPARDILTLEPLWRRLFGDPAWNLHSEEIQDSSFFNNRAADELTPQRVARGACTVPEPQPPFRIRKITTARGGALRLAGTDALDRTFLFKLDHPEYPELGSTSAIVASRILWALGYNVPPIFLVELAGTGDARIDGRRATASLFLDNVIGHFHFDWFRYRRELRGLRLASAWINDTDRIGSNTLVVERDGRATYYLIDFDSCLGSWQGRPKEPWRGHRHAWDLLGIPPAPSPPVVSRAIGRLAGGFDPLGWRPQAPNNAFNHMTPADAAWIARRIARLRRPHIEAIVREARLTDSRDAKTLVETLLRRQQEVLAAVDVLSGRNAGR